MGDAIAIIGQLLGRLNILQTKAEESGAMKEARALRKKRERIKSVVDALLNQAYEDWMTSDEIKDQFQNAIQKVNEAIANVGRSKQFIQACVDAVGMIDDVIDAIVKIKKLTL